MAPEWFIDETRHAGEERLDPDQVARYDERIPFDPSDEVDLLRRHGLSAGDTVVDLGTGTGVFPLAVAEHCDRVVAVDASPAMLDAAREKVEAGDVANVHLVHDGAVSYEHEGEPAAFVLSKNVLHHLPDFWKVEALRTVGETLEPGGVFRFRDLVYSFDPADSHERVEAWLDGMGSTLFTEAELHDQFREEFGTYDFLMEPMLEATGFGTPDASYRKGVCGAYTRNWPGEP